MTSPAVNARSEESPYWSYGDLGIFIFALALLALALHVLARLHLVANGQMHHPTDALQTVIVLSLSGTLYGVLKLRYRRPVLRPLGWVRPKTRHAVASLGAGAIMAASVLLYQHFESRNFPFAPSWRWFLLISLLAPILEESLFRGCLLPLIAKSTGNALAVILTAVAFALFHGPTDLAHFISFTVTGIAYGWMRVASGTTTVPAMAHAAYNIAVLAAAV